MDELIKLLDSIEDPKTREFLALLLEKLEEKIP